MSGIQILLIIVIVTLTMLLVIVGVQVVFIITGVRRILRKVEAKIDGSEMIDRKFVVEQVKGTRDFVKKKILGR